MSMERILICGTNWLGDSVMTMPAIQLLKAAGDVALTLMVKPHLVPLWEQHPAVDAAVPVYRGMAGMRLTVRALKHRTFDRALVFPHSFRSAWLPWRAGVPQRRGTAGHFRRWLLSTVVETRPADAPPHQAWEYCRLAGVTPDALPAPRLAIPPDAVARIRSDAGCDGTADILVLLPGAARGPSKQWPPERFVAVARALRDQTGCVIHVHGSPNEAELVARVVHDIGDRAVAWAGRTSLVDLAAHLAAARLVISNDSGGMHLAAAAGTPVVAMFGMTDPEITGPLGEGHRVVTAPGVTRSRDIPRVSADAEAALARISVEQVCAEARAAWEAA